MNKTIKALLLLFVMSTAAFAQDQDPKAKAILDDISKTTKGYKSIVSEYSQTLKNKDGKATDTQTGKIQVKGNKYRLELKNNTIVSDNKNVWTINDVAKEVSIKNYEPSADDAMDPSKIFTMYETGFKYKYDKEEKVGGASLAVINLYPSVKPEKKKFHTIKLYVDKAKKQIKMIKMLMKDGTSQVIEVKKMTPNSELSDTLFNVDTKKYKDELKYDIIDER
jgi:outer membrane lipoprotein-sorting protein